LGAEIEEYLRKPVRLNLLSPVRDVGFVTDVISVVAELGN
jgi:hypothetical protein